MLKNVLIGIGVIFWLFLIVYCFNYVSFYFAFGILITSAIAIAYFIDKKTKINEKKGKNNE